MSKATLGIISANYTNKNLEALTEARTIATIPFGGRYRLIDFPLSNFVNSGINTVGLITPYYYRSIMDHVGSGRPWELARKTGGLFILPGTVYGERSQTSRFILRDLIRNRRILDRSHSEHVIICDSSTVMNCDFRQFIEAHEASGCPITLMYKNETGKDGGIYLKLKQNGRVGKIAYECGKLETLFLGCLIVDRSFLVNFIEWYGNTDNSDLIEILEKNLDQYDVNSFKYDGYAVTIESLSDYKKASRALLEHEARSALFEHARPVYTKTQDEAPTIYKSSAQVRKSLVAAGCIIEGTVENSIIFRSAHIEKGAVVKDSIIMQKTVVHAGATVINAICDKYAIIGRGAHIEGGIKNPIVIKKNQSI